MLQLHSGEETCELISLKKLSLLTSLFNLNRENLENISVSVWQNWVLVAQSIGGKSRI